MSVRNARQLLSNAARLAAAQPTAPRVQSFAFSATAESSATRSLFSAKPTSLCLQPDSESGEADLDSAQLSFWRRTMLRLGGYYSPESTRMRAALRLKRAILTQADNAELMKVFGLPEQDFRCRFALSSLHLWLTLVRLRSEGDAGKLLGQELYDHFWAEMETRVRAEGVVVRLSKWMRELEGAFYGSSTAYDNALLASDGGLPPGTHDPLAASLRRNVAMGEGMATDSALLARYVRYQIACLALTESPDVLAGHIAFRAK